jgi:hypothetical protein
MPGTDFSSLPCLDWLYDPCSFLIVTRYLYPQAKWLKCKAYNPTSSNFKLWDAWRFTSKPLNAFIERCKSV